MVGRVLVVDDHDDVRAAIVMLLTAEGFAVVGEAADAQRGTDSGPPRATGCRAARHQAPRARRIRGGPGAQLPQPGARSRLMSSREAGVYGQELERSSAEGFITKSDLSGATLRRVLGDVVT